MKAPIRMLDVVALTVDVPDRDLRQGQVGTVVEELAPDMNGRDLSPNPLVVLSF